LSVGQPQYYLTCDEQRMKKATLVRIRQEAKETEEYRDVTRIKINAVRNHDMSKGNTVLYVVPFTPEHGAFLGRLLIK